MLENTLEFIQDNICRDEFVLCEDQSNDIGTEPARRKPADENIGIETDLYDTVL